MSSAELLAYTLDDSSSHENNIMGRVPMWIGCTESIIMKADSVLPPGEHMLLPFIKKLFYCTDQGENRRRTNVDFDFVETCSSSISALKPPTPPFSEFQVQAAYLAETSLQYSRLNRSMSRSSFASSKHGTVSGSLSRTQSATDEPTSDQTNDSGDEGRRLQSISRNAKKRRVASSPSQRKRRASKVGHQKEKTRTQPMRRASTRGLVSALRSLIKG